MKPLCVATPLLAAMVMGLPALASASGRGTGVHERVGHVRIAGQPDGPSTIVRDQRVRHALAEDQQGSVRRPPEGSSGGGSSGGGSGSGTVSGTASGRSGGGDSGGGSSGAGSGAGAVSRGESRRGGDDGGGGQWGNNRAVPRSSVRQRPRPYPYPYYYYRPNPWYYDRWGYGGFGLGYFYYSPWSWYGPGYYPYGGWGRDDGGVRLKVKPKDAEVLVDGYFAGIVDDFDGSFQSLKLDAGSYKIEVRKPGYESLSFDVRVQRDRTITFRGEMKEQP